MNDNYELYHHGVKGMKWGVRKKNPYEKNPYAARMVRGHAGPGRYIGSNKHKLKGAKRDLDILDKGGHLSIGLTKKRQDQFDKRDRELLNKKIAKLETSITESEQKKFVKSIQKTAKSRSARENMVETTSNKLKEKLERDKSFEDVSRKLSKHASDFERLLDESYAAKSKKESDRLFGEAEKAWDNYTKERNQAVDSLLGKYADTQIKNVSRNRRSISDAKLITTYAIDDLANWRYRGLN